jgi:uncharacterized protein YegP (UPF0339 family)
LATGQASSGFHLKAANGEIIAASEAYDTKAGVEKGIGFAEKERSRSEGRGPD